MKQSTIEKFHWWRAASGRWFAATNDGHVLADAESEVEAIEEAIKKIAPEEHGEIDWLWASIPRHMPA